MEIKKFRNKYEAELIPGSHSNIILGTCVWDAIIGKPKFIHPGMPEHLYNPFFSAGIIDEPTFTAHLEELRNEPKVPAKFAESTVEVDADMAGSLEHPQIGEISSAIDLSTIKKFSFGELEARTMSNLQKVKTDKYLDQLKHDNWSLYDGKIRRVFFITELFYGKVKIVIDKDVSTSFNASIKNTSLKVAAETESNKSVEYTFDHDDVPFAMRIERVRGFVG